jgi:HSP20 family protein
MTLLTSWNPFEYMEKELGRFHEEMNLPLTPFGLPYRTRAPLAVTYPPMNVWEEEEFLYAEAELPGMKLEDLEIFVTEDQLAIAGTRPPLALEKVEWHRLERAFGSFNRVIPLPIPVVPDKVEAHLVNGVLTIKMAKNPVMNPTRVPVQAV